MAHVAPWCKCSASSVVPLRITPARSERRTKNVQQMSRVRRSKSPQISPASDVSNAPQVGPNSGEGHEFRHHVPFAVRNDTGAARPPHGCCATAAVRRRRPELTLRRFLKHMRRTSRILVDIVPGSVKIGRSWPKRAPAWTKQAEFDRIRPELPKAGKHRPGFGHLRPHVADSAWSWTETRPGVDSGPTFAPTLVKSAKVWPKSADIWSSSARMWSNSAKLVRIRSRVGRRRPEFGPKIWRVRPEFGCGRIRPKVG